MNVTQASLILRAVARSGDDEALMAMMDVLRSGEVVGEADSSALTLTARMNKALARHGGPDSGGECLECTDPYPCPTRLDLLGKES